MKLRSAIVHLLVILLVVPSLGAQEQSDVWRSFAEKLAPGAFVVVHLKGGATVEGHFIQVTGETLQVLPKTRLPVPVRDLALGTIQSIDTRNEGMSPGARVLLGVGVAGGILAIIGAVALSGLK